MTDEIMVEEYFLMEPDNGHYNREYAIKLIEEIAEQHEVIITQTHETRDAGHGQEELFVIQGLPDNINCFISTVNDALY